MAAARAALDDYLAQKQGDLSDTDELVESVYRAAVADTMQGLRVFSSTEDHLYRGLKHTEEAARLIREMRALWRDVEQRGYSWGESNAMAEEQAIRADDDGQEAFPF